MSDLPNLHARKWHSVALSYSNSPTHILLFYFSEFSKKKQISMKSLPELIKYNNKSE